MFHAIALRVRNISDALKLLLAWFSGRKIHLILLVSFGSLTALGALDGAASDPVILGLTVVTENIGPGFFQGQDDPMTSQLRANFVVSISDLPANFSRIREVRVEDGNGSGWTINLSTYNNSSAGYIGGYGRWLSDSYALVPRTLLPLHYVVDVTLTNGITLKKEFDIPPPKKHPGDSDAGPAADDPSSPHARFVVNDDFRGVLTPYHVLAPGVPVLKSAFVQDAVLHVTFTVKGGGLQTGNLLFYDEKLAYTGQSPRFEQNGVNAPWLNGGQALRTDGSLNEVELPMGAISWADKENARVSGVSITAMETRSRDSNLYRVDFLYQSRSGVFGLRADAQTVPTFLNAVAQTRLEEAGRKEPRLRPAWWGSPEQTSSWEIALNGILAVINHFRINSLAPFADTPAMRQSEAASIESSWGITDRKSMIENLESLFEEGHHARYSLYESAIAKNPSASFAKLAEDSGSLKLLEINFRFVHDFADLIGKRSLLGWDMSRLIYLARDGYSLGYLSNDEAWQWIDKAAAVIRDNYDSWMDFGTSYLIGRMFWGGSKDDMRMYLGASTAMASLMREGGDWDKLPWPPKTDADSDYNQDLK